MDLVGYGRVLSAHRVLILVALLVSTAVGAAYAWTREPTYTAHIQLFVSTLPATSDQSPSETYQGGLFSQQRVASYVDIVTSPAVARAVMEDLRLRKSVQDVQAALKASVPEGTVLIDVSATDHEPATALAIARAVGRQFPRFVSALESAQDGGRSPVRLTVTSPPRMPTSPDGPKKALYVILGVLVGLLIGIAGAVRRWPL
jgi:capsular polysaccharide biosynthesis protein